MLACVDDNGISSQAYTKSLRIRSSTLSFMLYMSCLGKSINVSKIASSVIFRFAKD